MAPRDLINLGNLINIVYLCKMYIFWVMVSIDYIKFV